MNRAVYDTLQPLYAGVRAALPKPPTGERPAEPPGLVFCKRNGVRTWGSIRTAFEGSCREATIHDFRFHDLRHTCASWLIMKGWSLKEVQETEPRPAPRSRRRPRRFQHKISTKR